MKIGVNLSTFSPASIVELGALADRLGYDSVWIPDHLADLAPGGDKVDPWTLFGAIGARSSKIKLIPGVTDAIRIHPAKLANIVATLDDFTGGRAELALGAGEAMNLSRYGLKWEPDPSLRRSKLEETIKVIRGLFHATRSEPFSFDGKYFHLKEAWLDQKPAHEIKIFVGALGANETLRLIGRVADGWFPVANTLDSFKKRAAVIDAAAKASGRKEQEIEKIHFAFALLGKSSERERKSLDALKSLLFTLQSKSIVREMTERGILRESDEYSSERLSYQYMDPTESGIKSAFSIASKIPDDIIERYLLRGSPSEIVKQLEPFEKAGASRIVIQDAYSMLVSSRAEDCKEFLSEFSNYIKA